MSAPQTDMQNLYREVILDHSRNPRHFGRLDDATHTAAGINPLCGDKLKVYLRIDSDGLIESSSFEGTGCAISVASASLMTATVMGLPVRQAKSCCDEVAQRLSSDSAWSDSPTGHAELQALDGVRAVPARIKCATLAWQALRSALDNNTNLVTTE